MQASVTVKYKPLRKKPNTIRMNYAEVDFKHQGMNIDELDRPESEKLKVFITFDGRVSVPRAGIVGTLMELKLKKL